MHTIVDFDTAKIFDKQQVLVSVRWILILSKTSIFWESIKSKWLHFDPYPPQLTIYGTQMFNI